MLHTQWRFSKSTTSVSPPNRRAGENTFVGFCRPNHRATLLITSSPFSKHEPSLSELEQLLCTCNGFVYLAKEKFTAKIPPMKLVALNLSGTEQSCFFVLLCFLYSFSETAPLCCPSITAIISILIYIVVCHWQMYTITVTLKMVSSPLTYFYIAPFCFLG